MIYLQCAESALKSVLGDLTDTYFVGNAPFAHMVVEPAENTRDIPTFKVLLLLSEYFFFILYFFVWLFINAIHAQCTMHLSVCNNQYFRKIFLSCYLLLILATGSK